MQIKGTMMKVVHILLKNISRVIKIVGVVYGLIEYPFLKGRNKASFWYDKFK